MKCTRKSIKAGRLSARQRAPLLRPPSGPAAGTARLRLFFGGQRPRLSEAQRRPRSRRPPTREEGFFPSEEGEETEHKSSATGSLSASEGKGGERGNRNGPGAGAPARAAFKLRFHHLSQGAAANGTRARRRANHRRASSGRRPMAARVLGAWAKQPALLGCGVLAGVGAGSCLGCTWSAVLLRGLLCPASALLSVCELGFFFVVFLLLLALLPGGSREAQRRQPPHPQARSERAGVSAGVTAAGKGIRRRDAGVPGRPLGADEGEVEE